MGGVAAVAVAKWTQLTGLGSSDGGLNGLVIQHAEGQKKMEGVNLGGKIHWTLMNRSCVCDCVLEVSAGQAVMIGPRR